MNLLNPLSVIFNMREFTEVVVFPLEGGVTGLENHLCEINQLWTYWGLGGRGQSVKSPISFVPRLGLVPFVPVANSCAPPGLGKVPAARREARLLVTECAHHGSRELRGGVPDGRREGAGVAWAAFPALLTWLLAWGVQGGDQGCDDQV